MITIKLVERKMKYRNSIKKIIENAKSLETVHTHTHTHTHTCSFKRLKNDAIFAFENKKTINNLPIKIRL